MFVHFSCEVALMSLIMLWVVLSCGKTDFCIRTGSSCYGYISHFLT